MTAKRKYCFGTLLAVAFFLTSSLATKAQQDPQFSFYMFNKLTYNPAYAGMKGDLYTSLLLRNQWAGFEGRPVTQSLTSHMPFARDRWGVGVYVINDVIGADRFVYGMAALSKYIKFSSGTLSIGANVGFGQNSVDGTSLRSATGDYTGGKIDHGDQNIPFTNESAGALDLGAGLYWKGSNYYIGASAQHLMEPDIELTTPSGVLAIPLRRHLFFSGGYEHRLNSKYVLKPHTLIKTDLTKTQFDIHLMAEYKEQLFFGAGLRGAGGDSQDAIMLNAGMQVTNNLMFGYSYDITTHELSNYSSGSHEFLLTYLLGKPKAPLFEKVIKCPRFL
jgi:type IX secretion system PorP/SprF family membrane protein